MKTINFQQCDVIAYLEDKILSNVANENEMSTYLDWIWNGFISKLNFNTYKNLKREMYKVWKGVK
ncbi:hypothetical protein [Cytobacillus praedii]|uniref:Uncharacterized protein n=1 Tax=Cytobacillus praedii TaxID=1742358 RepID=A0A4R1ARZ7_9BACI|nr:hypothetical protein [Cytobacillus praedii]TCI99964.1 hypothetical protein E0Y62_27155 [Cytobacillus praedii]